MHASAEEDEEPRPRPRHAALTVWGVCAAFLLVPSLLVWMVNLTALGLRCAPGAGPCHGMMLGNGLKDTLDLAWLVGSDTLVVLIVATAASIAALAGRRPLLAGLSMISLPIAALVLPTLAVYFTTYDGCAVNEAGVGTCMLWGASMGMSFHRAAAAPWIIYSVVPYSFALALMIGAIGFMFFRRKDSD